MQLMFDSQHFQKGYGGIRIEGLILTSHRFHWFIYSLHLLYTLYLFILVCLVCYSDYVRAFPFLFLLTFFFNFRGHGNPMRNTTSFGKLNGKGMKLEWTLLQFYCVRPSQCTCVCYMQLGNMGSIWKELLGWRRGCTVECVSQVFYGNVCLTVNHGIMQSRGDNITAMHKPTKTRLNVQHSKDRVVYDFCIFIQNKRF